MAGSIRWGMRRRAVGAMSCAALLMAGLTALPVAPAAAAEQVDQHLTPERDCTAANYPASAGGGGGSATVVARESFVPQANRATAVVLCVNATGIGANVTGRIRTGGLDGSGPVIATFSATAPATGYQWLRANLDAKLLTTPGRSFVLEATLPGNVEWHGTCGAVVGVCLIASSSDEYPAGSASAPGTGPLGLAPIGDFAFRTMADPDPRLFLRQGDFRASVGQRTEESFDAFPNGTVVTDQVPGVAFSSPNGPVTATASPSAATPPNVLTGPVPLAVTNRPQVVRAVFARPTSGFGFAITDHDGAAGGRATVHVEFQDGTSTDLLVTDDDAQASTPYFVGYQSAKENVVAVEVRSGLRTADSGAEPIGIDEFAFARHVPRGIVYAGGSGVARDVYVVSALGGAPFQLTSSSANETDPVWSPDGAHVAFVSDAAGEADVWVMDADGTDAVNVTSTVAGATNEPSWSPDGARLAFVRSGGPTAGLDAFVAGIDGTNPVDVTASLGLGDDHSPAWSPDGSRLVVSRPSALTGADLWSVASDGSGGGARVTSAAGDDVHPSWSTAGIAFASNADGDSDLFVVQPDGSGLRKVFDSVVEEDFPSWGPDEDALTFRRAGRVATVASAGGASTDLTTGADDTQPDWFPGGEAGAKALSLTTDRTLAQIGSASVNLRDIPGRDLPLIASGVQSSPVGSIPVGSIPVGSIPVGSIPVGSIDMKTSPVGSIPVGSIPVGSIPVGSIGLDNVLLSSLPIDLIALLAGSDLAGFPMQTITLAQVLADPVAGPRLKAMTLAASGLGDSLFGDLSLVALLLGGLPLDQLPLPPGTGAASWCELFAQKGWSCSANGVDPSRHSLAGAQLASAPVGSIPVGSIPVGSIPVGSIPVGSIPVGSIDLGVSPVGSIPVGSIAVQGSPVGSIPVGSIPVGSIPVGSIPVGSIPVGSIDLAASPVGSIPVGSIANKAAVIDCTKASCPVPDNTLLRDIAYAILPSATLADLGPTALQGILLWHIGAGALDGAGITLASLTGALAGVTLADLKGAFGYITLYEIVLDLLVRSDYPWERLPIDGMQDFAGVPNNELTYRAAATITCAPGDPAALAVKLPSGFRMVDASGKVSVAGSAFAAATPVFAKDGALRFNVPSACSGVGGVPVVVTLQARPGFRTGQHTADLAAVAGPTSTPLDDQAPVLVVENGEPDSAAAPRDGTVDRLLIGNISQPNDVDTYRLPMPAAGSRVKVALSHIAAGADFDLVVGAPATTPLQSSPVGSIPVGSIAMEDRGAGLSGAGGNLAPETLQDIPVGSIPVGSISATRGNDDEAAQVIAEGSSPLLIQVSGYNGSSSPQSYVLRIRIVPPPALPPCPARTGVDSTNDPVVALPATSSTTKTLFLVNRGRMGDLYGAAATTAMVNNLATVASRTEVGGLVVPIDADATVKSTYRAWDASPCSIAAANDVVRAVNNVVNRYRNAAGNNLKYVVLLGTDEALPFARVPDLVTLSNEQDNAGELGFMLGNAPQQANALYAAAALGYVLTDDAYGAFSKADWLGRELYLPQVSVSRMVESPADISGQLDEYKARNGLVDPTTGTALVTGYDFLADGAQGVAAKLQQVAPNTRTLINDTWKKADLTAVYTGATPVPTIASTNAHYSHYQAQPAGPASGGKFARTDLFNTADVPDNSLPGRLLFTMGCHAGLNVPDTAVRGGLGAAAQDWAQEHGQQKAAVYLANTGYGYGDTASSALSERLMVMFAGQLADKSTTIGEKYVKAKAGYFSSMGTYGVFDEKALVEANLYGLPFWRVGPAGSGPAAPPQPAVTVDAATGNATASITIDPALTRVDDPARGTFWAGPGGATSYAPYRHIQPLETRDVTVTGRNARSVFVTELTTDDSNVIANPATARPTIDLAAHEDELASAGSIYPANLTRIGTTKAFGVQNQQLVLVAGQSRPDGSGSTVQRLVRHFAGEVGYSSNADATTPTIRRVAGVYDSTAGSLKLIVDAADNAGGTGVKRAVAMVLHPSFNGKWKFVDLTVNPSTGQWTGALAVPSGDVQIAAEVLDGAKNVAYSTNKGQFFRSIVGDAEAPAIVADSPQSGAQYALGQVVKAAYSCSDPIGVASCEGSVPSGSAIDTSTPGAHTFTVTATDNAGNSSSVSRTYTVSGSYTFVGFKAPLKNPTYVNVVDDGTTVPVKWQLFGPGGGVVRDLSAVTSITRTTMACGSCGAEHFVPTTTAGSPSGLSYDLANEQFVYQHAVAEGTGGCESLKFTFADGSSREVWFSYR